MNISLELTMEQQFKLKVYIEQTKLLSSEEARILLVEMMRQNMIKDNVIKNLLKVGNERF
ncbi:NblA/ycf18 family protein [Microcoleus sp. ARI1-B5]|uniref:NblA/ycf18 family protein n=1 Tax=unclassified Microcoleus TaxID=2642155 RepID=UPI002FD52120